MPDASNSPKRRAAARGGWRVRKYELGDESSDDLSETTTVTERLEMMWQLAVDAWTSSGNPLPDYDRGAAPVRKFLRQVS